MPPAPPGAILQDTTAALATSAAAALEYISEDEHIQHLERSGALNQVAGSQSILSQELCYHNSHNNNKGEGGEEMGGFSQMSNMAGFSQTSLGTNGDGDDGNGEFDSQRMARKYGLLSQDPFALPARSLTEPPLSQRSTASTRSNNNNNNNNCWLPSHQQQFPMSLSQGSSGGDSSANFGSLLDAVQLFQSQEAEVEKLQLSQESTASSSSNNEYHDPFRTPTTPEEEIAASTASHNHRTRGSSSGGGQAGSKNNSSKRQSVGLEGKKKTKKATSPSGKRGKKKTATPLATNKKTNNSIPIVLAAAVKAAVPVKISSSPALAPVPPKEVTPDAAAKPTPVTSNSSGGSPCPNSATTPTPLKKRKRKNDTEQQKQQHLAQRAAALAQRTINDADLAKRLLLSMALTRENPRSAPETLPGPGFSLPEGFFWAHYPPLEKVLKDNMAEYYELSVTKCQSAQQQSFNNTLVQYVRAESDRQGWLFSDIFTDKSLRDRIRCYYKTHIQNAKKRLRTMVKNPTKRANARHLCAHLDMIENNVHENEASKDSGCRLVPENHEAIVKHQEWGAGPAGKVARTTRNSPGTRATTAAIAPAPALTVVEKSPG